MIHEVLPVGPLGCNCSVIGDEISREAIVIDPGDDVSEILEIIARNQLTVKMIVITHAHIDHIGGAQKLRHGRGRRFICTPPTASLPIDSTCRLRGWASNRRKTRASIRPRTKGMFSTPGRSK